MAVTRIKEGRVTVTLSDGLERFVRRALDAATNGAVEALEAALEPVAEKARAEWYGPNGVTRQTGKSGNIQVVTTVDPDRDRVMVAMGSLDDRRATWKNTEGTDSSRIRTRFGREGGSLPLPMVIHRIESKVAVPHKEWWRRNKAGEPVLQYPYVPGSGAKRFLFVPVIRKPGQDAVKGVSVRVAEMITRRIREG